MAAAISPRTGNRLLDILPARLRSDLIKASKTTELSFGTTIYRPGDLIRHVYFPISGYISLVSPPSASEALEVGMIGREGGFGVTVLLDTKTSPLQGLVQGGGTALRLSAEGLRRRVSGNPALRRTLHRYLYVLMAQLAQTAACNRHHLLEQRLARWMLMTHGFRPIAHIQRRSSDEPSAFLRIPTDGETCFADPTEARDYIVDRAKTVIDRGDATDTPGRLRHPPIRHQAAG